MGSNASPAQWVKGSGIVTAAAWIQSLASELPYVTSAAIKKNLLQARHHSRHLGIHQLTKETRISVLMKEAVRDVQ